ncbi:Peptidase S24-like protein [Brevundimonas sp. SH203]|nr:Peptidase S24-like protein [Brevundimonas sp. SH203]
MELSDIPDRLRLMRRSQADLARTLDLDPSSLTKTIKGVRRVQPAEAIEIEKFFGEKLSISVTETAPQTPRRKATPTKIPVYGYAAAGQGERIAYADSHIIDYLDPPPFWRGGDDLAYVRLVGESMEPRYFSGEIVAVRLNLPPAKGSDCLIEFTDGTAKIKTYQGQRDGRVFASQYNPDQSLSYEAATVAALHSVWKPGMI